MKLHNIMDQQCIPWEDTKYLLMSAGQRLQSVINRKELYIIKYDDLTYNDSQCVSILQIYFLSPKIEG